MVSAIHTQYSYCQIQYQMFVTQIFSVVSLALGIYILVMFLKGQEYNKMTPKKSQFHLGCFLADHNIAQSYQLVQKVEQLHATSTVGGSAVANSLSNEVFNRKGVEVAIKFQDFIEESLVYKEKMRSHVQLAKATYNAYQEYIDCSAKTTEEVQFSREDCTANWNQYEQCTIELQTLKNVFSDKLSEKDRLRAKMGQMFLKKNGGEKRAQKKQYELEKEFDTKNSLLKEKERDAETRMQLMMQKLTAFRYNYAVLENNTLHYTKLYNQCHDHITEYRECEELSDEIRTLGHGTIESLDQKVLKKRLSLTKMNQMLSESKGEETSLELQRHYNRGLNEYRKLHKLFAEMKAKMEKHCGCSEEHEKKLKLALDSSIALQKSSKEGEAEINSLYAKAQKQLGAIGAQRQRLLSDLTEALNKISPEKDSTVNIGEVISDLEEEDKVLETNLLTYERNFNQLMFKCNQIKDQLSLKLPAIDLYTSCLNKKTYFEGLKAKLDQMGSQNENKNDKAKKALRDSLNAFTI